MGGQLLETKFHVPSRVGTVIARARLTDRLRRGSAASLTLVSAPAGSGKSTLMAELASMHAGAKVAWVSLDAGDGDSTTFWTYVFGAIDRVLPGVAATAQTALESGQDALATGTALLNALADAGTDLILVLDDFHVVESTNIPSEVAWLVEHLPANVHLVIGTRADPDMPLARLRARGALTEIRAADLRFTGEEAAAYLNDAMGLDLTGDDLDALEGRTEGWIAALQLAAISLQGREDSHAFITSFAGDDRYIVDYLVEEVLRRQSDEVRAFLLQTSILGRMTGPLCEAVTGRGGGREMLEALDRANLFLVPLDDQRRWYRYHQLFGGVLQAYLLADGADAVRELHRRASDWFERHGDRPEAIRHAFESRDFDRAADLIELAMPEMGRERREPVMRRWLEALPKDVVLARPVLSTGYAGVLLSAEEPEGVDELLTQAERWLAMPEAERAAAGMAVADHQEFRHLPAGIELFRAALAKTSGDLEGNLAHARRVLEIVDETDYQRRGGAAAFLALAHLAAGELEEGYRRFAEAMADLEKIGRIADVVGGSIVLADIRLAQGRLTDVRALYEDGLRRATSGERTLRGAADMHTGLAEVSYERGDLAAAAASFQAGSNLGPQLGFPRHPYRGRVLEARLLQASGDLGAALRLLDEAEQVYVSDFSPDVRPIAALRARLQIAHGQIAPARRWADARGLTVADEPRYIHEYEHLTLARLLVAEGAGRPDGIEPALQLLDHLREAAELGQRDGSRIAILAVQALAFHARGDLPRAAAALEAAAALAEAESHVRVFLDEGPQMTALLQALAGRATHPYLGTLLRASSLPGRPRSTQGALVEPLSERELDVLRLLRSELSGPEMAGQLVVSVNTLRTHTRNIYAKLGVTSRRAALRRAEELGLL